MISVVLNVLYQRGMKGWGRGLILWRNSQMKSLCLVWNLFFLLMIYFIIVFLFGYLNFFGEIQALKTTKMERKHRSLSCIKYHEIPKCLICQKCLFLKKGMRLWVVFPPNLWGRWVAAFGIFLIPPFCEQKCGYFMFFMLKGCCHSLFWKQPYDLTSKKMVKTLKFW